MHAQIDLSFADAATAVPQRAGRMDDHPATSAGATRGRDREGLRLGELLGALSHALDLAESRPPGHGLRSCWIGQQIGRAVGMGPLALQELHDATLLKDAGGSTNAVRICQLFLADDLWLKHAGRTVGLGRAGLVNVVFRRRGIKAGPGERIRAALNILQNGSEIERALVEVRCVRGAQVARQLRFSDEVADGIQCLDEHWDGGGYPQGLAGKEIPLYSRIALLAQVVDLSHASAGPPAAREAVARGSGRWFEPRLADAFEAIARDAGFWRQLAGVDLERCVFEMTRARQESPVDADQLDDIAQVFGQIADAKSRFTAGHSARVALRADQIAARLGLGDDERRWLRRAAWLHDVGKLGVSTRILDKPSALDPLERAALRRHAAHTEQILGRIEGLGSLAQIAGAHHENLDGSGYPRGCDARHIRLETRIITTADVFDTLSTERPGAPAMPFDLALQAMRARVGIDIDADCLAALVHGLAAEPS